MKNLGREIHPKGNIKTSLLKNITLSRHVGGDMFIEHKEIKKYSIPFYDFPEKPY